MVQKSSATTNSQDSHLVRRRTPHFTPPSSEQIRNYRLGKKLGNGAFGVVYEARSLRSGKEYALKVIKPVAKYIKSAREEAAKLQEFKDVFGQKTRLLNLYKSFDHEDNFVLVFERLGPSLRDTMRVNRRQPFSLKCIAAISREIFSTLSLLHQRGYVHTDIKVS